MESGPASVPSTAVTQAGSPTRAGWRGRPAGRAGGGRAVLRVESRRPASAGARLGRGAAAAVTSGPRQRATSGGKWVTAGQHQDRPLRDPDLVAARAPSHGNRGKRGRPTGPPARRAHPRSARPRPTSTRHPHTLPRRTTGGRAAWEAHVCLKGTKLHFDRGCSNPASRTAKFQILIRETESHRWSRKGERQRRR